MPMNPRLLRPRVASTSDSPGGNGSRTLYYNNFESDLSWSTLGNWWDDAAHTVPASSLPGPNDDVVLSASMYGTFGGDVVVKNFLMTAGTFVDEGGSLTVTGTAEFTGNVILFNYEGNFTAGTVILNSNIDASEVIFTMDLLIIRGSFAHTFGLLTANGGALEAYDTAQWGGNVGAVMVGSATFFDSSRLGASGSVSGTATFEDNSCVVAGGTAGTFVPNPPPSCP